MSGFQVLAILLGLTSLIAMISNNVLKLKGSVGLAMSGAIVSIFAYITGVVSPEAELFAQNLFKAINFEETIFHGILCFLLFAGAMHVDLNALRKWKWHIGVMASLGVVISTFVVATIGYYGTLILGVHIPYVWWLVMGALISPTDPIAVLALLKDLNAPKDLEAKIGSESLLNDGVGVVVFLTMLAIAVKGDMQASEVGLLFAREAIGGISFGLITGVIGHYLLKATNDAPTETAMTLAFACGGYALAEAFHVSAPLAVAVMGIVIGNGISTSMVDNTQKKLLPFWHMLDEIMNMVMFALVGVAMMASQFSVINILVGVIAVVASLSGRLTSVGIPIFALTRTQKVLKGTTAAMTWGGLRGGLSLAMVMSLPQNEYKDMLVTATWIVVMFSLLVQAPTVKLVLRKTGLTSN